MYIQCGSGEGSFEVIMAPQFLLQVLLAVAVVNCQSVGSGDSMDAGSCRVYESQGDIDHCGLKNRTVYVNDTDMMPDPEYLEILRVITQAYERSTNCSARIQSLLCNYFFPPCDNGMPRPLCYDTCHNLTQSCSYEWMKLKESTQQSRYLSPLISDLNCNSTYYTTVYNVSACWNVMDDIDAATSVNANVQLIHAVVWSISAMALILLLVSIGVTVAVLIQLYRSKQRKRQDLLLSPARGNSLFGSDTASRIVNSLSRFRKDNKIQSQRMLLENIPEPFMEIMSSYVDFLIQEDKLQLTTFLADGPHSEVYQGYYNESQPHKTSLQRFVAIKRFKVPFDNAIIAKYIEDYMKLSCVEHPNVLKLVGVSFGPDSSILIVYPYFPQHDLHTYLRKLRPQSQAKKEIDVEHLIHIVHQISMGMKALGRIEFRHQVLHVSTKTCLISSEGTVVVGDMSYSWFVNHYFNAQEVGSDHTCVEKCNVWSFAVTAWEVLTLGEEPSVSEDESLPRPLTCPLQLYNLLEECLQKEMESRPTFSEISEKIDTMRNDDSFKSEVAAIATIEEDSEMFSQGYLRILPDQSYIEENYNYHYVPPPPVAIPSPRPISSTVFNTSPLPEPSPISVSKSSPIVRIFSQSEDEEGYVDVFPSPARRSPIDNVSSSPARRSPIDNVSSSPARRSPINNVFSPPARLSPIDNVSPPPARLSPIGNMSSAPARLSPIDNILERSDSEDSLKEYYYNIHFHPARKSNKNNTSSNSPVPVVFR